MLQYIVDFSVLRLNGFVEYNWLEWVGWRFSLMCNAGFKMLGIIEKSLNAMVSEEPA